MNINTYNSRIHCSILVNIMLLKKVLYCYDYMYRTLTDPKLFRCLPHRRIVLYNIIRNLHGSFLNIIFQKNPPANIVFTMYAGEKKVMLISRYFSASISACILFSVSHLPRTQPGRPRSHPSQHCTDFPAIPCAVNPCNIPLEKIHKIKVKINIIRYTYVIFFRKLPNKFI